MHIQFEGIKTGLKQTKDGYILTLAVHPDGIPDDLVRDFVGSRYMCVMVRLGDDEQPLNRKNLPDDKSVMFAGMLCRDPDFWTYITFNCNEFVLSEGECTEWFKCHFDVSSRAELKTNIEAKQKFLEFKERFEEWKKEQN